MAICKIADIVLHHSPFILPSVSSLSLSFSLSLFPLSHALVSLTMTDWSVHLCFPQ